MNYITSLIIVAFAWTIYIINKSPNTKGKGFKITTAVIVFVFAISGIKPWSVMPIWNWAIILLFIFGSYQLQKAKITEPGLKGVIIATMVLLLIALLAHDLPWKYTYISNGEHTIIENEWPAGRNIITLFMLSPIATIWFIYWIVKLKNVPVWVKIIISMVGINIISVLPLLFMSKTYWFMPAGILKTIYAFIPLVLVVFFCNEMQKRKVPVWLNAITCLFTYVALSNLIEHFL